MNFLSNFLATMDTNSLSSIISDINTALTVVFGLLTAGIVILAIMLAIKFFTAETEDKRKNAKQQLIYAIIGVIVLVALLALTPVITELIKDAMKPKATTGTVFVGLL